MESGSIAKRLLYFMALILSALIFIGGVISIVMYFWNGVIARIGEADQSLLFWYLPVLFMGFIGAGVGWAMGSWAWERFTDLRSDP